MITISNVASYNRLQLRKNMKALFQSQYTLDINKIMEDIDRMMIEIRETKDKEIKAKYRVVIAYLKILLHQIRENGAIDIDWKVVKGEIKQLNGELKRFAWCGVDSVDYIYKKDEKTMYVSYSDLWNVMAYEIAHKGIAGTDMDDIEKALDGCSIFSPNKSDKILQLVDKDAYDKAINLKVYRSNYVIDYKNGIDYFGTEVKHGGTFKEIIKSSVNRAMLQVLEGTLQGLKPDKVSVVGVFEDIVIYNTKMASDEATELLAKEYIIRTFNRYFEIKPKVKIVE